MQVSCNACGVWGLNGTWLMLFTWGTATNRLVSRHIEKLIEMIRNVHKSAVIFQSSGDRNSWAMLDVFFFLMWPIRPFGTQGEPPLHVEKAVAPWFGWFLFPNEAQTPWIHVPSRELAAGSHRARWRWMSPGCSDVWICLVKLLVQHRSHRSLENFRGLDSGSTIHQVRDPGTGWDRMTWSRVSWRVYHGVSKSISNQKWEDIKSQGNLIDWHPWILEILVIQTKTKAVSTRSSTAPSWLHKGTTWRIRQKDHRADETASFLQTQSARYVFQTEWIECNTMRHLWNFSLPIEPTGGTETVWLIDRI